MGWQDHAVALVDDPARAALLRRGFALEYATLGWNVAGIIVLRSRRSRPGQRRWPGLAWIR